MKNRDDFQDDGRVVADMSDLNDAGGFSFRKFKNKDIKTDTSSDFSAEDRRIYIKTALLSSMLIAGIFIVAGALFIMFCQHIWLK